MLRLEVLYISFLGQPIKTIHWRIATWVNWMMPSPSGLNPNCAITPSWISVHNGNTTCWYLGHKDICVCTVTCRHKMSEHQVTLIVLWFFRSHIAENNLHHSMLFLLLRINSTLMFDLIMLFPASCLAARILWWWWGDSKADRSAGWQDVCVFLC